MCLYLNDGFCGHKLLGLKIIPFVILRIFLHCPLPLVLQQRQSIYSLIIGFFLYFVFFGIYILGLFGMGGCCPLLLFFFVFTLP